MRPKFCSIIIASYIPNEERREIFTKSLTSVVENTKYPHELTVIDNGGNTTASRWLMYLTEDGDINTYIKNSRNMHFAYARNQGIKISWGDYICIMDNDIKVKEGWLEDCVEILEAYPDKKIYATPIQYPTDGLKRKYARGHLELNGKKYKLNTRAGSNCFVIRRKDLEKIGNFPHHRIGGSRWTDRAVRADYLACVIPGKKARDLGLRKGYNMKESIPIGLTLSDDLTIYFNTDGFKDVNPDEHYY